MMNLKFLSTHLLSFSIHVTSTDNKRKKYRMLTISKCFSSEIHHFHLKYLGITISQTLMATNSPLFSMMFTVTWDHRIQNWYYHCCKCVWCYLPSWCGGVTNTSWVFQPLVHHRLSLLGVLLKPVVVPVLLTRRSLIYGSPICFLLICCLVTCRNLPNSIPSTRAMPNWLVTFRSLM